MSEPDHPTFVGLNHCDPYLAPIETTLRRVVRSSDGWNHQAAIPLGHIYESPSDPGDDSS